MITNKIFSVIRTSSALLLTGLLLVAAMPWRTPAQPRAERSAPSVHSRERDSEADRRQSKLAPDLEEDLRGSHLNSKSAPMRRVIIKLHSTMPLDDAGV